MGRVIVYKLKIFLDDREKAIQELEVYNFEVHTPSLITPQSPPTLNTVILTLWRSLSKKVTKTLRLECVSNLKWIMDKLEKSQ